MENKEILLSICIPTYNRAQFLDLCLSQITKQIVHIDIIELIVSDNASNDTTATVVKKYIDEGIKIDYILNAENIGADKNIEQCFSLGKGKYVWIFGDDDLLLDGMLQNIVELLKQGDYGNVYLSNYWYSGDFEKPLINLKDNFDYTVYENRETYLFKVNYWVTFVTGNIVNKSVLPKDFDSKKFIGTNLVQVYWILTASILSKQNLYIKTKVLACKGANSGGYNFFEVFGVNLRKICIDTFKEYKISEKVLNYIDNSLLINYFPSFIISNKRKLLTSFKEENPKIILKELYKKNSIFWILNYPLFFLPKKIDTLYLLIVKKFIKQI